MFELLEFEFFRNALLAAILVGVACGVVGTFVVVKRIVFISGGVSHAAFGGIGLGYLIGLDPLLVAMPFSILAALVIGTLSKKMKVSEDSAIGLLWVIGMALGILFIGLAPGFVPDLFGYLFGSILTVPFSDVIMMIVLDVLILAVVMFFYKELQALSFDEEYAEISGVPVRFLYLLLLSLVALTVVMLIKVVGIILVIALLTIPAITARQFTNRLGIMLASSVAVAIIMSIAGLWLSYVLDVPSGATIVLSLVALFFFSVFLQKMQGRLKKTG